MTTFELYEIAEENPRQSRLVNGTMKLVAAVAGWHARRQTVLRLARLDAIQLGDIGLDAEDVTAALNGDGTRLWARIDRRNASR